MASLDVSRCIGILKGQNSKNREKLNNSTKNEKTRARGNARPCHPGCAAVRQAPQAAVTPTGSPWWPLAGPVSFKVE